MSLQPELSIPSSNATVEVKVLHAGHIAVLTSIFWEPTLPGRESTSGLSWSFLIENIAKDKRVVFDLGIAKNTKLWPPAVVAQLEMFQMRVDKDVATQLKEGGILLEKVDAVIWSHAHVDHIGDVTTFPLSTELVVGEGTTEHILPPYPLNEKSFIHEDCLKGRKVTEISFSEFRLSVGGFRAHDYFSDGSFYLLDVPGHISGHIAGLARVTPTTFVLLGADTCHNPGLLRPSSYIDRYFPCPGALWEHGVAEELFLQEGESSEDLKTRPLLRPTLMFEDLEAAKKSIKAVADTFDTNPDVFVILAHDNSVLDIIDLFPKSLNAWKEQGLKEKCMWAFLDETNPAFFTRPVQ